jgi:hypothetical protein
MRVRATDSAAAFDPDEPMLRLTPRPLCEAPFAEDFGTTELARDDEDCGAPSRRTEEALDVPRRLPLPLMDQHVYLHTMG